MEERRRLQNLLAVIHRDGGQYVAEHGIEKATEDAMRISSERIGAEEARRSERERAERAEAEVERLRGEVDRMERWRDEADELADDHFGQIHEAIHKLQMLLPIVPPGCRPSPTPDSTEGK